MNTDQQTILIARLRNDVEEVFGQNIKTSKDFDNLSQMVQAKTSEYISSTTLKRVWGYLTEPVTPRQTTLDILSQFVGYPNWEAYKAKSISDSSLSDNSDLGEADKTPKGRPLSIIHKNWFRKALLASALLVMIGLICMLSAQYNRLSHELACVKDSLELATSKKHIIRMGQKFASFNDYLQLFGIVTNERPWSQPLPGHPDIYIWGHDYHGIWRSEGDLDSLMPTITEYCYMDTDPFAARMRNIDHYNELRYRNEMRINFIKGLNDSTFTFLGVYVVDREKSDTTHIVWNRIAEECDLSNLNYLETLRQ